MGEFTNYQEEREESEVLLIYLLLNGFDMSQVKTVKRVESHRMFGLKIFKICGMTSEYVDINKIETEVDNMPDVTICARDMYEFNSKSPVIYRHIPAVEGEKLVINDMGVLSKIMCISENEVISSIPAKPMAETDDYGFMTFMEYALKSEFTTGKWHVIYDEENSTFKINYLSANGDAVTEETLFEITNIGKSSTYKLVIYLIKKVAKTIEEWQGDNFEVKSYLKKPKSNG